MLLHVQAPSGASLSAHPLSSLFWNLRVSKNLSISQTFDLCFTVQLSMCSVLYPLAKRAALSDSFCILSHSVRACQQLIFNFFKYFSFLSTFAFLLNFHRFECSALRVSAVQQFQLNNPHSCIAACDITVAAEADHAADSAIADDTSVPLVSL